jgi:tRNA(fMet)-specific endonuclease VapC
MYGASKSARSKENHRILDRFFAEVTVLAFDEAAAAAYGELRCRLDKLGEQMGANDMLIAAQALAEGRVLVSGDAKALSDVSGLHLENWRLRAGS